MRPTSEEDTVLLVGQDGKRYLIALCHNQALHTEHGVIRHDDLIGRTPGCRITTHLDYAFYLLTPSTSRAIKSIRRAGQIVYPKDSGYALLVMNMRSGKRVIEAGTGSRALAIALAQAVMPDGHVYSYDVRENVQKVATKNLDRWGLLPFVTLKQRNIAEGFGERDVDACFLDIRGPWLYVHSMLQELRPRRPLRRYPADHQSGERSATRSATRPFR